MTYEQFLNHVKTRIKEFLPEDLQAAEIKITQVQKNNNMVLDGICIRNAGETIAPQIYLNHVFQDYENGIAMNEILHNIAETYLRERDKDFGDVGSMIKNYDAVKDHLLLKVVNKASNAGLLQDTPHKDIEGTDLAAVINIEVVAQNDVSGTICVKQHFLDLWGQDMDTLYQQALQNMVEQRPVTVNNLAAVLFGFQSEEETATGDVSKIRMQPYEQYILSNSSGTLGAAAILYPDVLQILSENAGANLFLLPSSIHELIVMQDTGEMSAQELQAMVMSANQAMVAPEEVLSNEVYYYDKDGRTLSTATVKEQTDELLQRMGSAVESALVPDEVMERG